MMLYRLDFINMSLQINIKKNATQKNKTNLKKMIKLRNSNKTTMRVIKFHKDLKDCQEPYSY